MGKRDMIGKGPPCSWETCGNPAVWKIVDAHGVLVRYWCESHHQGLWKVHSHPGMTPVLIGGQPGGSKDPLPADVQTGRENSVRDHPSPPGPPAGDRSRRPVDRDPGGQLHMREKVSDRSVATVPAAGGAPDRASAPPAPAEVPALAWWTGAGELQLNDEQRAILWQEVDPESVLIRPDGIVYLPWAVVWRTLLRAFSPYVPSIVPLSKPAM